MSLKITDQNGFKIGGVLNPSITEIYVRPLPDMADQFSVYEDIDEIPTLTKKSIKTTVKTTVQYDSFLQDLWVDVEGIYKYYRTMYSVSATDMNAQYYELHLDLMSQIEASNPNYVGKIEIVGIAIP